VIKHWECEKIRDLLARYCERLDEYDIDGVAQCFSEDAATDYGAGRGDEITGRASIANVSRRVKVNFVWHELPSGKFDIVCLRYLDRLCHTDGEWLIYHRRVEVTLVDGFEGTEWNWVDRNIP